MSSLRIRAVSLLSFVVNPYILLFVCAVASLQRATKPQTKICHISMYVQYIQTGNETNRQRDKHLYIIISTYLSILWQSFLSLSLFAHGDLLICCCFCCYWQFHDLLKAPQQSTLRRGTQIIDSLSLMSNGQLLVWWFLLLFLLLLLSFIALAASFRNKVFTCPCRSCFRLLEVLLLLVLLPLPLWRKATPSNLTNCHAPLSIANVNQPSKIVLGFLFIFDLKLKAPLFRDGVGVEWYLWSVKKI